MNPEKWRASMGEGIRPWAQRPGGFHEVTESSWSMITGAPSADSNMVLVWGAGAEGVTRAMSDVTTRGVPALVLLAGAAKESGAAAPQGWQQVGEMPIMQVALADAVTAPDPRVRLAGPEDEAAVTELMSEAFGMPTDIARVCTEVLKGPLRVDEHLAARRRRHTGLDHDGNFRR